MDKQPFLCVITPIFDPALDPAKHLISALQKQSFGNFIHVLISNGKSPQTEQFIYELRDSRFIYDEVLFKSTITQKELVCSISERREFCLKKYNCKRYLFLNADLKIIDNDYFRKLFQAHLEADILITQIRSKPGRSALLPKYPIQLGRIDASNISISDKIAKHSFWPADYHPLYGIANDYRFFQSIEGAYSKKFLPFISAVKDGNNKGDYQQISNMS